MSTTLQPSGFPEPELKQLATEIVALLKGRGESVCVVETVAGGLISASILSVPGASKVFKAGLTLYTLDSRIAFANWTQANIQAYKGPTPGVVSQLAHAAREKLSGAPTYALAESGTAGPTPSGEGRNRQPGYVALAISAEGGTATREVETGSAVREENMLAFAKQALLFLRDVIKGDAKL